MVTKDFDPVNDAVLPHRSHLADNQPIETPPRAPSPVYGFGTMAVHAGAPVDPTTGAVIESVCSVMLCEM